MFKIKNTTFYVTRADSGSFDVGFTDYTFQAGDIIEFKIYRKDGLDEEPLLVKSITASEETTTITIDLLSADTNLGSPENEIVEYWYEMKLNGSQTVFCYDETGPKKFMLYPSGIDI